MSATSRARLCIALGHLVPRVVASLGELPSFCAELESWGASQVVLGEHLVLKSGMDHLSGDPYPWAADELYPEPLTMLAAIATATRRIRLSTGILIAPVRPAVLLAKTAATVDAISGGRLDLGLGAGWWDLEFDALGVGLDERMSRLEEIMAVCRALWAGAEVRYEGRWARLDGLQAAPTPQDGSRMPVWFGAGVTRSTARLIARAFDGWIGRARMTHAEVERAVAALVAACDEAGRDHRELAIRVSLPWLNSWGNPGASSVGAAVRTAMDAGERMIDAGATHLLLPLDGYARDRQEAEDVVGALAAAFDAREVE